MINLAPYRYRNILKDQGGPIDRIEYAHADVFGRQQTHATAFLLNGLLEPRKNEGLRNLPDGAGSHDSPMVACFMAVSEAIERWALRELVQNGERKKYGFDIDSSSNGMAAFPGLFRFQAKRRAFAEAVERHCLIGWWDGCYGHKTIINPYSTDVRAIRIENPISRHSVVLLWRLVEDRYYNISFGAGKNDNHACWRATIEMERTAKIVEAYNKQFHQQITMEDVNSIPDLFEKRIMYFSRPSGFEKILERLKNNTTKNPQKLNVLFNGLVDGPWNKYACVWRIVFDPMTREHLSNRPDFLFW